MGEQTVGQAVAEVAAPKMITPEVFAKPATDCKRVAGIGNRSVQRWSDTDRPAPVEEHRANEVIVGDQAQVPHSGAAFTSLFVAASHDDADRSDEPKHAFEFYRDIPRSCICQWLYRVKLHRWTRHRTAMGCPWHDGGTEARVPWSAEVRQP